MSPGGMLGCKDSLERCSCSSGVTPGLRLRRDCHTTAMPISTIPSNTGQRLLTRADCDHKNGDLATNHHGNANASAMSKAHGQTSPTGAGLSEAPDRDMARNHRNRPTSSVVATALQGRRISNTGTQFVGAVLTCAFSRTFVTMPLVNGAPASANAGSNKANPTQRRCVPLQAPMRPTPRKRAPLLRPWCIA